MKFFILVFLATLIFRPSIAKDNLPLVVIKANAPEDSQITKIEVRRAQSKHQRDLAYEITVLYKNNSTKIFRTLAKEKDYSGNSDVFFNYIENIFFLKYGEREIPIRLFTDEELLDPCYSPYDLYSVWINTSGSLKKVHSELCDDNEPPYVRPSDDEDLNHILTLRSILLSVAMISNLSVQE